MSLRQLLVPSMQVLLLGAMAAVVSYATAAGAASEGSTIVMAKDFMFAPTSLTVQAGSTVTWTNRDDEPHTVVSDGGLFRSAALDTNESFSFRFDKPGTFRYACSIHPHMVGTIVVRARLCCVGNCRRRSPRRRGGLGRGRGLCTLDASFEGSPWDAAPAAPPHGGSGGCKLVSCGSQRGSNKRVGGRPLSNM
jgi:plastocyanin